MKMAQKSNIWLRAILCGGLICAGIILFSAGSQQGGVMRYLREVDSSAYFFYMEIVNRTFENSLLDPTSDYYKSLKAEVEDLMNNVYNCSTCSTNDAYDGAYDMSFSNGSSSVIAKMTLVFHTTAINPIVVKFLFINSIIANPPQHLQIDLQYTRDVQTPVVATTTTAPPTAPMTTRTPLVTKANTTTASPVTSAGSTSTLSPVSSSSWVTSASTASKSSITSQSNGTGGLTTPSSLHPTTGSPSFNNVSENTTTPKSENQGGTTTTQGSGTGNKGRPYWFDWVPGWGIALLVLAALILLLLIILFILLCVRWFCTKKKEKSQLPVSQPSMPSAPSPAPTYVSHSPAPVLKDMSDNHPDAPKRNKTGLYVVNP